MSWRLVRAAVAQMLGHEGISAVARAARPGRGTITRGLAELFSGAEIQAAQGRQRRPGGGRKTLTAHAPTLQRDLEALVEPTTRGNPRSGLRWTCKSLRTRRNSDSWIATQLTHVTFPPTSDSS